MGAVISGSGLYTPPESISNDELVASFNEYAHRWNREHAAAISSGREQPLAESSSEFVVKASGIRSRHVVDKRGILDPDVMRPQIRRRSHEEPSLLCEISLAAARQALEHARREPREIDGALVACSSLERPYAAVGAAGAHRLSNVRY